MLIPTTSEIHYTHSQHIFKCLDCSLRLTICLRLKSSTEIKSVPIVIFDKNQEVKTEPLLDTIEMGTLWRQMICLTYNLATKWVALTDKKWADLVNPFIITQMESYPSFEWGNPTINSIVILSHFYSGIGRGWSFLEGCWCSAFTCWQVKHLAT